MKKLAIYDSIDQFFSRVIELKDRGEIERYFRFLKKVPNHAPFNNTLVFIQNPNCSYYATATQWLKRFERTIKTGERPMVILFPFGPVEFVYDIDQTEGKLITQDKILFWWRENGGILDQKIIENTQRNLDSLGVSYIKQDPRIYFNNADIRTDGFVRRSLFDNNLSIHLHPRYPQESVESYGVLCHEIAHILLGHLGSVYLQETKNIKVVVEGRSDLPTHIKEFEAELVSWIVFNSYGIDKNESYLATWLTEAKDLKQLEMSEVLKVAGKIQDMGKRRNVFKMKSTDKKGSQNEKLL